MGIIRDGNLCYGCKTCQLICSFHHTKAFWPEKSSINVLRNPQNGTIKWCIKTTCDKCSDEVEPLCVKYCVYGALHISQETHQRRGKNL